MKRSTRHAIVQRLQRHKLEISRWALHERLNGIMSEMEPTTDWVIGQIRIWRGPTLPNELVSRIESIALIVGGIFGIAV